ncbi:MAG TPA: alpha/beta hydrolase [Mycobacterium sp.]|nr:alpha/beta hydrolase [Mycobacterium sp.]
MAPTAAPRQRRSVDTTGARGARLADRADGRRCRDSACRPGRSGVDVVSPQVADPTASIVYLHGGAYVSGSPRSYRRLVSHLAAITGRRVYAVDYRLAPEHPYPAALDDSIAVYTSLLAAESAETVVLAGDSAGGGLALATAVRLWDAGAPLPAALVCIAPWADLSCSGESMRTRARRERMLSPGGLALDARRYANGENLRNPLISPLFADLRGLPPLLIQVGDDEILLDDATRLAAKAEAARVSVTLHVWPRLWHIWHLYAGLMPEPGAAMRVFADFIAEQVDADG